MATVGEASGTASVARAYFTAVGNRDLDAMVALWEPGGTGDIKGLVELTAPGSYRAWFANLFQAVPDFKLEILTIVTEGEQAAVRWRGTGTFDGSARFEGLEPNGAEIDLEGCDVVVVRDGKLQRNDAYMNGAQMARQLGALPAAGSLPERTLTGALNIKTKLARRLTNRGD
jgi:steroid delta-isomerase-like uncharacterized protein